MNWNFGVKLRSLQRRLPGARIKYALCSRVDPMSKYDTTYTAIRISEGMQRPVAALVAHCIGQVPVQGPLCVIQPTITAGTH